MCLVLLPTSLAQHRPVARFQYLVGHNTFLRGQDFWFYYVFKTNFSGRNKICGRTKEIWGALPPNAPHGYGPGATFSYLRH